jgi:hypothetical protein
LKGGFKLFAGLSRGYPAIETGFSQRCLNGLPIGGIILQMENMNGCFHSCLFLLCGSEIRQAVHLNIEQEVAF